MTVSLIGLVACSSPPPKPAEVRSRLTSDLGHVLSESVAATNGTTSALPGSAAFDMLERAIGQRGFGTSTEPGSSFTGKMKHSLVGDEVDPDAIIAKLNETLFTDANEVSEGVYAVPASLVCTEITYDDQGNETSALDPECATQFAKAVLRVRVEDNDDELRFAIQVDAFHDEPLTFALTHASIAVSIDLDDAERAMNALALAFGEEAPNARLAGQVTSKLVILGTAHVEASVTIDHALDIAVADQGSDLDGPDAFRLTSAAALVGSVELDGTAGAGNFELGLGATTAHIPGEDALDLDLPGLSVSADLANGQPLHLTNIGLGDHTTTLSKNGVTAVAIDLNPDDGRKLAAMVTADSAAGLETLTVTPKLDLRVSVNHTVLGDEQPLYDVTRVLLDGSLRAGAGSDQIEVMTGDFSITTNPASYGFSATAGQCVAGEDQLDPTTSEYFTAWTVGTCQ